MKAGNVSIILDNMSPLEFWAFMNKRSKQRWQVLRMKNLSKKQLQILRVKKIIDSKRKKQNL